MDDTNNASTASVAAAAAASPSYWQRLLPPRWPNLVLDSGASFHMVGDAKLLSNLCDAVAGSTAIMADGSTRPVTKIGDIQIPAAGFSIPDVFLVPGLQLDVISVRQLTWRGVNTWFDRDKATLYVAPMTVVGVAVAPPENMFGLYVLQFLRVPKFGGGGGASSQPADPCPSAETASSIPSQYQKQLRARALLRRRLYRANLAELCLHQKRLRLLCGSRISGEAKTVLDERLAE